MEAAKGKTRLPFAASFALSHSLVTGPLNGLIRRDERRLLQRLVRLAVELLGG